MAVYSYDEITFQNIILLLNQKLGISLNQIAEDLSISIKTLTRWRKGSPYHSLNYFLLFQSIERACKKNDLDFLTVLTETFPILHHCHGEKNIKHTVENTLREHLGQNISSDNISIKKHIYESKSFIEHILKNGKEIESIYMSFHSGLNWLKNKGKGKLLEQINQRGIKLYVIVNDQNSIGKIIKTMTNPDMEKFYISLNQGIIQWNKCVSELTYINFRISDYPILRKLYLVNYKDGTSEALTRDYVYDFCADSNHEYENIYLTDSDLSLNLFRKEFDFLWDSALTYDNWSALSPKKEELVPPGKYILLYLTHRNPFNSYENPEKNFIISTLQIGNSNNVKLEVNVAKTLSSTIPSYEPEYTYYGNIKLTRHTIYMQLFDELELEQVSISINRPLHDKKRFLGIMTALSPQAQPVAFKCALLKEELIKNIDMKKLTELLKCKNNNWGKHLMILEEQDINCFYSNQIIINKNSL